MYYRRYRKDSFRTYVDFISSLPAWQIEGGGNKKDAHLERPFDGLFTDLHHAIFATAFHPYRVW